MLCHKCGIFFRYKSNFNKHLRFDHGEIIGGEIKIVQKAINNGSKQRESVA